MSSPNPSAVILLEVLPVAEEDEDLDTIALAAEVAEEMRQALAGQPGYVVTPAPDQGTRGDVIQLAGELVQQAWNHKVELGCRPRRRPRHP